MILNIILIIVGVVVVLWGADRMTDGAVGIAERLKVPQIVIGLTIVAMGPSMPEFCVSLVSALKGTADLAVGNVVGSNIFNAMLIVGCAAAVAPMTILPQTVRKDVPFALIASVALWVMCIDNSISRIDAALLFVAFLFFMYVTLKKTTPAESSEAASPIVEERGEEGSNVDEQENQPESLPQKKEKGMWLSVGLVVLGLACLIIGSNIFVDNATALASAFGVSEAVIGLTIVAGGTSMPELATSIVAARKGNSGIAIGNVLGSNVFNILLILGGTGLIAPMTIKGITDVDLILLVVSMVMLWLFSYTKLRIERWEGLVLIVVFVGYMTWLIANAV